MNNKNIFLIAILMLFAIVSCEDIETINVDPDRSPSARPQEVLTSSLGYLGWIVDSRLNGQSFLWGQYWTWGPGVSLGNAPRYVAEPDDHNNYWARAYSNSLTDVKFLIDGDNQSYSGIGKVLKAYIFQGLVDHFGDVPYSDALLGEISDGSVFNPTYDSGQAIYDDLIVTLDSAIDDLSAGADVGPEDLLYGGDLSKWIKFANSLKLRILMRQSVTGDKGAEVMALVSSGNFIESADDAAAMAFAGNAGSENPMYADEEAGIGLFYVMSDASYKYMTDLSDPRVNVLYNPAVNTGTYVPVPQGGINDFGFGTVREDFSQPSAAVYGNALPVYFMSDWEVWFLRAEAAARYGTADDDAAAFETAVEANFNYLGLADGAAFASGLGYGGDLSNKIRMIALQKWVSMNGVQEDEGWIEARRFDTPSNPMFTGSEGVWQSPPLNSLGPGVYPSAWLYPGSELSLNTNAPNQRILTDKIFWDN